MTATLKPREYQTAAIDAVFAAWGDGMKRPAIVLPTGAGKTVVFAHLIQQFRRRGDYQWGPPGSPQPGTRVIVLVHRDELADQAMAKIRAIAPDLSVGKVKALDNELHADVMVCSVQTLNSGRSQARMGDMIVAQHSAGRIGLIITDECHHAAAASYKKVYDAFPDALNLGVTATMARGDKVGLGSTWDEVVYERSPLWMMSKGYLTGVKAVQVDVAGLDMSGVKSSRGDFQAGDLGDAMEAAGADKVIATAYKEHAGDRPGVVFTPTVATATATADEMNAAGIRTEVISGETPRDERLGIFERFRTGETQVLANCMVLTEGFDAPWASCAVIARPTQSQPLYVQMVGRVLRPFPGKTDALVLDVVGASASNKLRTLIDLEPGVVRSMKPFETLEEAVVREAEATGPALPGSIGFELKHKEVSLFKGSDKAWLRTHRGVMFIGCGDTTVFLFPTWKAPGLWDVCTLTKGQPKPTRTEHVGMDLGSAMAWGEATAEDYQAFSTEKAASWRKAKPSEKQQDFARSLGIQVPETMRRGQLSDAMSVVFASRVLDKFVR
jgi:superfamily II DNA or RNA helicase